MKVEILTDPGLTESRAVFYVPEITPELEELVRNLEGEGERLVAHTDRGVMFLPLGEIIRIYSERQQVLAQTMSGIYPLRQRLYELEERLSARRFVRISNSEIVNARMITGMDFSLTGTIRMSLRGGVETYASRRYVSRIRKQFEV